LRHLLIAAVLACLLAFAGTAAGATTGSWALYPAQSTTYTTAVQQPINADGSSNFKSTGKSVVPVKFELSSAPGPVVFQSIFSDGTDSNPATTNDYSFLSFTPNPTITFNDISTLRADYAFTVGNCGGGSLRWSVRVDVGSDGNTANDGSVFIYYGGYPSFTDCTTSNQSSVNMIGQPDLRYDTSQVGGTFYDSYAGAQALVGGLPVVRASLVIDSGWFSGDQKLNVSNVTVNDNAFVPLGGPPTKTCDLPPATVRITKLAGSGTGPVNEPVTIQPNDTNEQFRVVDCKYMYNLATSSLSGPGTYQVEAVIGGTPAGGAATFDLR
jgi:hypothetical protein